MIPDRHACLCGQVVQPEYWDTHVELARDVEHRVVGRWAFTPDAPADDRLLDDIVQAGSGGPDFTPLDAPADPLSPQWEACKVCGGDHWTKDHGIGTRRYGPDAPAVPTDLTNLEWLVWFARKSKGTVTDVTRRAIEQNPYLDCGAELEARVAAYDFEQCGWEEEHRAALLR
jgi:hypothetical protein